MAKRRAPRQTTFPDRNPLLEELYVKLPIPPELTGSLRRCVEAGSSFYELLDSASDAAQEITKLAKKFRGKR